MPRHNIELTVNGAEHESSVEPGPLLGHAPRNELGGTGTNVGGESRRRGAWTVHVDGDAVKSCPPGSMTTATACLNEAFRPERGAVRDALEGPRHRCGGDRYIVNAGAPAADGMGQAQGAD